MRQRKRWVGGLTLLWCPAAVFGGQLPDSFTLGRYIPADAWFFVHEVHNPERDFIYKHWMRVLDALGRSGIDV